MYQSEVPQRPLHNLTFPPKEIVQWKSLQSVEKVRCAFLRDVYIYIYTFFNI